ncbi:MAG: hypothetical protein RMJ82_13810 [Gemmatales bacterium]|nr:hypothetical protein [Gemmatales bacterium]
MGRLGIALGLSLGLAFWGMGKAGNSSEGAGHWQVSVFEADITIPPGHACMGGGIAEAKTAVDPLWAKGFVLARKTAEGQSDPHWPPVVVLALDWCQLNNEAYDHCRAVVAQAVGTMPRRVLLATVHQHDAPIFDLHAQKLLDTYGLQGWICDAAFFERAVTRIAEAAQTSLRLAQPVTHIAWGQAKVERLASNRRVVLPDGKVAWTRGSASGDIYQAPEGETDPWLRMFSLWNGDKPVVVWSCYAVHPMSYYGRGEVSADFVGLARQRWERNHLNIMHVYFSGCAGDVTAGKYNNGDPANRPVLAERLHRAMEEAWQQQRRRPLEQVRFRCAELFLPPRDTGMFRVAEMQRILNQAHPETRRGKWQRISAALGLSWRARLAQGRPIDIPALDFNQGQAYFLILPAETFVGYQLALQRLRPNSFVMTAGFGDGAPGYLPTDVAWKEGYDDNYCWVAPMCQSVLLHTAEQALGLPDAITKKEAKHSLRELPRLERNVILRGPHPGFCWFHPRAAVFPSKDPKSPLRALLTLQKHLGISDYYSGLYVMTSLDGGITWRGPIEVPALGWRRDGDITIAVADVTPGYHPPTGKVLAIGTQVRYDKAGRQLDDVPQFSPTAYAVYDPSHDTWSPWQVLELPNEPKFNLARCACAQWAIDTDGSLLLPIYFGPKHGVPTGVAVARCTFDGQKIAYQKHGTEIRLETRRGLAEPSLLAYKGMWYLTIRHDESGDVTRSKDGLEYEPIRPWRFDTGEELGNYNTQQHWLVVGNRLYLTYTRRGAHNDHIFRHRAPLFMAEVDAERLVVLRKTEQILIPERGAPLGNFGVTMVSEREAWVTDAEYYLGKASHERGADNAVWLVRVHRPD